MRIWPEYENGNDLPTMPIHRLSWSRPARPRWIIASLLVAFGTAIVGEFLGAQK
jgi:hypothetical protein